MSSCLISDVAAAVDTHAGAKASLQAHVASPSCTPPHHTHLSNSFPSAQATPSLAFDFTKIPTELESACERWDSDHALHPTIIKPADTWTKKVHTSATSIKLSTEEQGKDRQRCFDLLDALTRSGTLTISNASLHVLVAATHCFDQTLMNTIVQGITSSKVLIMLMFVSVGPFFRTMCLLLQVIALIHFL